MKTKVHWDVMSDQDEKPNDVWHRQEETTAEGLQLLQVPADNGRTGLLPEGGSRTIYNNNINMPDEEETALLAGKYEKIAVKDFHAEIRAFRDVEDFLNRTLLLLDLQTTGLTQIVDSMLHKLHSKKDIGQTFTIEEAKQAIFTEDSVHLISKTIQGTTFTDECGFQIDQSWICIMCDLPNLTRRHVVISRLQVPANLGATSLEVRFVILVMTPTKEKSTKSALETGRTFATLFLDINFRHQLLEATTEFEFKQLLQKKTKLLIDEQGLPENRKSHLMLTSAFDDDEEQSKCPFGRGLYNDIKRRLPHYFSDFKDGIIGHKTPHKVLSTTFFLYFACVLPNMAFGMLNNNNTQGVIGVKKILFSQCVGGLLFAVFGGQPLIVLLTTAPLALYTKLIYNICEDFDLNFDAMYACVGLWNAFFLFIYVFFNLSKLMQFSSRSTEEIFSLFITFAFSADAIKDTLKDFKKNYHTPACQKSHISAVQLNLTNISVTSTVTTVAMDTVANDSAVTSSVPVYMVGECLRENSILFLLLMLGTVWTGITLYNFTKTPFLNASKREILADYALPVAVLLMSFFGSFIFRDIKLKPFEYSDSEKMFQVAPLEKLPVGAIFAAAGLGFSLSLLFFMDQNISSALVNTPTNKLKKGSAYHLDLFVVAVINGFLSVFTFPWIHAALPHSPLHVKALADLEDRIEQGHVHQVVVHVRETRLTGIISHVLIGLSMLLLPYPMAYIPRPVLDGLFLYVAITALFGNQLFDRILLLFTEQSAYPPNHYIRRVPQRKVHMFTVLQLVQLLVLCVFGFSPIPYMKMVFPVLIMLLMPIRHKLVPKVIEPKYLKALDGH